MRTSALASCMLALHSYIAGFGHCVRVWDLHLQDEQQLFQELTCSALSATHCMSACKRLLWADAYVQVQHCYVWYPCQTQPRECAAAASRNELSCCVKECT